MSTEQLTTIYVRDISEDDAIAFDAIKTQFGFSSNNKVIKTLFHKYLNLLEDNRKLQEEKALFKRKFFQADKKLDIIRDFGSMLNELSKDETSQFSDAPQNPN